MLFGWCFSKPRTCARAMPESGALLRTLLETGLAPSFAGTRPVALLSDLGRGEGFAVFLTNSRPQLGCPSPEPIRTTALNSSTRRAPQGHMLCTDLPSSLGQSTLKTPPARRTESHPLRMGRGCQCPRRSDSTVKYLWDSTVEDLGGKRLDIVRPAGFPGTCRGEGRRVTLWTVTWGELGRRRV